jgi:FMN-dependent NADH-azoreductase
MKTLLVINSSARSERSITRRLTNRFVSGWQRQHPDGQVIIRDVGAKPPAMIDHRWIAAAFAREPLDKAKSPLAESEELIEELFAADTVVVGAPMYNFGMPAALKAYFDQVVRVGRTFAFDPESEEPYVGLIPSKPVIVITSKGAGGYEPDGPYATMNFLEPHIAGIFAFLGLTDTEFVKVEFEEFQDGRLDSAIARSERQLDGLLARSVERQLLGIPC